MILIVGLGNPGKKYDWTPHNLGFHVLDYFRKENKFPVFVLKKKLKSTVSEGFLDGQKIVLAKPQTFMNESGRAVKKLISNFKFLMSNVMVVHDDIDLPFGKIKIVKNRGSAGHKGVESIVKELGTKNFGRFRIGSKPATNPAKIKEFVLQRFTRTEEKVIKEAISQTVQTIKTALAVGIAEAMARYNQD